MDRSGKVLSYARARSAGFDMLDEEVLAMIRRAQPLPALSPVALKAVANENDLH
jgi:protein TonB